MDTSCNSCLEYQIAIQNMKEYIRYYEDKLIRCDNRRCEDFKMKRELLIKALNSYEKIFEKECCLK
jgi:hypothetical protein